MCVCVWRGDGACPRELIHRHLLPEVVCSCCVSRNVSKSVARRRLIVACRDLPITCFLSNFWGLKILKKILSNFWGLKILKKLNTEIRIYLTKFGNVTFILKDILLASIFYCISRRGRMVGRNPKNPRFLDCFKSIIFNSLGHCNNINNNLNHVLSKD